MWYRGAWWRGQGGVGVGGRTQLMLPSTSQAPGKRPGSAWRKGLLVYLTQRRESLGELREQQEEGWASWWVGVRRGDSPALV